MGAVYLGHDPDLDRSVAIKRLHAPCAGRLLQEARGLARVSHPNVVGVHAVECEHDRVFVAMEYVEGRTLSQWSRRTRRSWQEILRVLVFAGRGLAAVHAAGLVHRDFKPDNVLVGADGRVRLGDFGLVGEFGASETWSSDPDGDRAPSGHDLMITASGSLGGTPAYMAPERLRGEAAGPASDQYAFAVTAYEALYGQRPFSGDRVEALHWNATQGRIDPLPSRRGVPLAVHRVLMRALESDPRARFADMDACLECLRTRARAPRRRSRVGIATVAAFTFAGLAACSRTPTTIASATVCRTPQDLEISR
jgi:serine/threonine protein kinase